MTEYKLYHRKSKSWVEELYFDESYLENPAGDIIGIDSVSYSFHQDNAAVFSDGLSKYDTAQNPEYKLYEQHGLERIYLSEEAYKYYSEELDSWLVSMSDVTMFEYANKNNIYPMFNLRRKAESDALVVREEESIKWLDENTKLKKVKVSE